MSRRRRQACACCCAFRWSSSRRFRCPSADPDISTWNASTRNSGEPRRRPAASSKSSPTTCRSRPTVRGYRISLPSDRSFATYAEALARFDAPPLPASVDLFWNQGYFDVRIELALPSPETRLWVRANFTSELGKRIRVRLTHLRAGAPDRTVEFPGAADWVPLEPRVHEAAWYSLKGGFAESWALDRFVFLLCLIAPFVHRRSLAVLVGVLTAMQGVTLTGAALGLSGDLRWLPGFAESGTALAILLLAVGNLAAPGFRVRWLLGALIGALWGFGIGTRLALLAPYVGDHAGMSIIAFNVGVALGEFAMFGLASLAIRLTYRILVGPAVGIVIVSMLAGHAAWHWMIDGGRLLAPIAAVVPLAAIAMVSIWMLPALAAGLFALYLPPQYGGTAHPSLLTALLARKNDGEPRG